MKRAFYFFIFNSSLSYCPSYVVTPFARAISQRIYLCARLVQPVQFLKDYCSNHSKREKLLFDEWERFYTFKQVNDFEYEHTFITELFRVIYEDTVTKQEGHKDDLNRVEPVSTDAIAFRYFIIQRVGRLFSLLYKAQDIALGNLVDQFDQEKIVIEHPEIKALLNMLKTERCLLPVVNEWDHLVHYKNLMDSTYMKEFLLVTYWYTAQMVRSDFFYDSSEGVSQIVTKLDELIPKVQSMIKKNTSYKGSFLQVLSNVGVPLLILSLLAMGQLQ